jgi:predicted ATPase
LVETITDNNHGDTESKKEKSPFIGRGKEINEILEDVKSSKGTRLLLVGESGIGKTALLDEINRRLAQDQDQVFVGYYSKKESLIAPSQFLLYPFTTILANLVKEAEASQRIDEKIDRTVDRIKRAVIGFAKEEEVK